MKRTLPGRWMIELAAGLLAARAELHELAGHGGDAGEMVGDLLRGVGGRVGRRHEVDAGDSGKRGRAAQIKAKQRASGGAECLGKRVFMPVVTFVLICVDSIDRQAVGPKFGDKEAAGYALLGECSETRNQERSSQDARRQPLLSAQSLSSSVGTRISRFPAWLAGPTMPSFSIFSMIEAARL